MSEAERPRGRSRIRTWLTVVVVALVVAIAMFAWMQFALSAQRRAAGQHITERTATMLRLSAVPLGWAVRAQMLAGNRGEVESYLRRFVQEPGVSRVVFVNPEGTIEMTTDPKLERQAASSAFPGLDISANQVTVKGGAMEAVVSVPIMGYDNRLGTLIVSYAGPGRRRAAEAGE